MILRSAILEAMSRYFGETVIDWKETSFGSEVVIFYVDRDVTISQSLSELLNEIMYNEV